MSIHNNVTLENLGAAMAQRSGQDMQQEAAASQAAQHYQQTLDSSQNTQRLQQEAASSPSVATPVKTSPTPEQVESLETMDRETASEYVAAVETKYPDGVTAPAPVQPTATPLTGDPVAYSNENNIGTKVINEFSGHPLNFNNDNIGVGLTTVTGAQVTAFNGTANVAAQPNASHTLLTGLNATVVFDEMLKEVDKQYVEHGFTYVPTGALMHIIREAGVDALVNVNTRTYCSTGALSDSVLKDLLIVADMVTLDDGEYIHYSLNLGMEPQLYFHSWWVSKELVRALSGE